MAGGLIQIFSYGAEDVPLISKDGINLFKIVYHKHSLFSIEEKEMQSETDINFGGTTVFKIKNYGDLMYNPYLRIELPKITVNYIDTSYNYINKFNNNKQFMNFYINFILSKYDTILYNYNITKLPIYISKNFIINNTYESNLIANEKLFNNIYDIDYNSFFNLDSYANDFQKIKKNIALYSNPNEIINKKIYYSTFNINYLTTILNNSTFNNDKISINKDYLNIFKNNFSNYILKNNDIKFLYNINQLFLTNNSNDMITNYLSYNTKTNIITQISYDLQYYYSNIKYLYIYSLNQDTTYNLKSIYYINNSIYSNSNSIYINNVHPFINLYDIIDNKIESKYIENLYFGSCYTNEIYKITPIIEISNDNINSYKIKLDTSTNNFDICNNAIYMIFADNKINLYENENFNIYNVNDFLLPLCFIQYNNKKDDYYYFNKIDLSLNITNNDYIYLYKDILVINEQSQKIQYIIINDYLYNVMDSSFNNIQYSDNIYISKDSLDISHNKILINNIITYILFSTESSFSFIDYNNNYTFIIKEFIFPSLLYINIKSNFLKKRMKKINYIKDIVLDLDTYTNLNYNINELNKISLATDKNVILYTKLYSTLKDNFEYIKNIILYFLDINTFFKLSNKYTSIRFKSISLSIDPIYKDNYWSNIISNNNNNYLSNMISIFITNFINYIELNYNLIIIYISNLKNVQSTNMIMELTNNIYNKDYELLSKLYNIKNYNYLIQIKNIKKEDLIIYDTLYFKTDISLSDILLDISINSNINYDILKNSYKIQIDISNCNKDYYQNYTNGYDILNISLKSDKDNYYNYFFIYLLNNNLLSKIYLGVDSDYSNIIIRDISSNDIRTIVDDISNDIFNTYKINKKYNNNQNYMNFYQMFILYPIDLTINKSIDISYILYHYIYDLYIKIKTKTNIIKDNNFKIYNDFLMYQNLWNIKKMIDTKNINSQNNLDNYIYDTTSYIYCNLCFATNIDHISLNNTLIDNINNYFKNNVINKIINLLNNKIDYFNYYSFNKFNFRFYTDLSNLVSLNINLTKNFVMNIFYFFIHYLYAIQSDIDGYFINYNFELVFGNYTYEKYYDLKEYFDSSLNIFNDKSEYLGKYFNLSLVDLYVIQNINKLIYDVYEYIIVLTIDNSNTKNIIYKTLNLKYMLYNLINDYSLNFYNTEYEYKELIYFFYKTRINYINQYKNIINSIMTNSSFSYDIYLQLSQYSNFKIDDYDTKFDYLNVNTNTDISYFYSYDIQLKDISFNTPIFLSIDKKNVINNFDTLDFLSIENQTLIDNFNKFFNTNYDFYSDYKYIYIIYFYFYKSYSTDISNFELYQDINNTSINNYIIYNDIKYNFANIVFTDNMIIKYLIDNNRLYDISNNLFLNYEYINDILYIYDKEPTYQIINNLIYDFSDNHIYTIINNLIYDISKILKENDIYDISYILIGNKENDIFNILSNKYKYNISSKNQQLLYNNYKEDNIFLINNNLTIYNNIYYDISFNIKYKLSFSNDINHLNFILKDILNNKDIILIPSGFRNSDFSNNTINIFNDLIKTTFNISYSKNTLLYLQETIIDKINNNNTILLFNNILNNSIISNSNYNKDIYICSSFNNYFYNNQYKITNNMYNWLINYNSSNINQIYIFNQTLQSFYKLDYYLDISNNLNLSTNIIYFVPDRKTFIPLYNEDNVFNIFNNNNVSIFTYMLNQKEYIIKNNLLNDISNINLYSNLIKDKIINTILDDLTNNNNSLTNYDSSNCCFIINSDLSIDISYNNDISFNSFYIQNSNIISYAEILNMRKSILDISSEYNLVYDNELYYIKYNDINYLLTIKLNNFNNIIFNLDNILVTISIDNIIFPRTLYILNGKIYRINMMDFEYKINKYGNLEYNFNYDFSYNILSTSINKFNYDLSKNVFDFNKNDILINKFNIPINYNNNYIINYQDLSNYYLNNNNDKQLWDNINLLVSNIDYYIILQKLPYNIKNEYIILNNNLLNVIINQDISNYTILKVQDINNSLNITMDDNLILKYGIKNILEYVGLNKLNYKNVFYYWENFIKSKNTIIQYIKNNTNFIDEIFITNEYITKIYNLLPDIQNKYDFLFELPDELFKKKYIFNVNNLNSPEIINTDIQNKKIEYQHYIEYKNNTQNIINRDEIPKCSWISFIGHYIFNKISFNIDDNIIEEIDDQIIQIFNFMKSNNSKDKCLNKMIGNIPELYNPKQTINEHVIYIPLPFFYESHEKALPLISLIYSKLTIILKLKNINDLIIIPELSYLNKINKLNIKYLASYVYLDYNERKKFAELRHEYLLEIKKNVKYFINTNINSLKLDIREPVKDMIWFYLDNNIKYEKNYWNYTGITYKEYDYININNNIYNKDDDVLKFIQTLLKPYQKYYKFNNINLSVLSSNDLNQIRSYIYYRQKNPNPIISSELVFNGHKRFSIDGFLSGLVTSLKYYKDTLPSGINLYNFCREPKLNTHSGALNFKFASDIYLNYKIDPKINVNGEINLITRSHNVLRIASGIGCLSW